MDASLRIPMTEYLEIDLADERWRCRRCAHDLGSARGNYKEGTLVYDRDPTEIHRPLINPARYGFTFAPDPAWCRILEFYCPGCGTQIEAEYLPPGHPPTFDMQIDVDALKAQWAARPPGTVIPLGRDVTAEPLRVDRAGKPGGSGGMESPRGPGGSGGMESPRGEGGPA